MNADQMKLLLRSTRKYSSDVFLLDNGKLPGWDAKTVAWSYDMEGHAQKCVDKVSRIGEKKKKATVQSVKPLFGRSSNQKGRA